MGDAVEAIVVPAGKLTTEQVMERLGKKRRTVQDLASQGMLRFEEARRPGTKPERLYFEEDVAKLEAAAGQRKLQTVEPGGREIGLVRALPEGTQGAIRELAEALAYQADVAREQREEERLSVPIHRKLWLTLREAHEYSGLGLSDLKQLCKDRKLESRRTGRRQMVIMRASLDGFQG